MDQKPPSLGSTLFLGGACIAMGTFAFLTGGGFVPAGDTETSAASNLVAIGVGALFIFAGLMVIVRDLAGARNNEEMPANAPAFLRFSAGVLNILLLAVFAAIASAIAFGMLSDPGNGLLGLLFRVCMGAFAILLWLGVIYLVFSKLKNR